ncbi:type II toxin-antitoxin system PemK/MazF family toxin [Roseofilum casamattae]|uniref:mRNA interferase n=1 Tax=Roseofilum casamattae BLCC-M143 TaxID=3022442 RepID=A0ABT7C0S4_9CYAN|nr:type II toxin-antitoxin system PemK/MazF family toxin [Roseofilum casamattae]MDJ1184910.1 type II toxin-antitoxin system PemK/MazF family toxin [Roseofilum casamattae BLCC-M143]
MFRGEVWLYQADPTIGDEIGKTRPCIIVNSDKIGILRLKVIVPVTGWNDVFSQVPWMVRIEPSIENGLSKLSAADAFQVRSVSQKRLIKRIGRISEDAIAELNLALATVLDMQ